MQDEVDKLTTNVVALEVRLSLLVSTLKSCKEPGRRRLITDDIRKIREELDEKKEILGFVGEVPTPKEMKKKVDELKGEARREANKKVNALPKDHVVDREVVIQIANDFSFFAANCLPILYRPGMNSDHPDGGMGPFILTKLQRKITDAFIYTLIYDESPLRAIILKTRQLGCTTLLLAFILWLMQKIKNYQAMIIIDKDDHATTKRLMFVSWIEFMSSKFDFLAGIARGGKREKMIVLTNGSKMFFESATSQNPGTSEFLHALIESEKPKWVAGRAEFVRNSVVPAIPLAPWTVHIDESTACGMEAFYKKWQRTTSRQNLGVLAIFAAWFESEEYRLEPRKSDFRNGKFIYSEDEELYDYDVDTDSEITEEQYAKKYNLSPAQILFRRHKIQNSFDGDRNGFDQEFPTTPAHAYRMSGNPFFPGRVLSYLDTKLHKAQRFDIFDMNGWSDTTQVISASSLKPKIKKSTHGKLYVRSKRDYSERYFIGVDVAEGKMILNEKGKDDPDWTSFTVIDSSGNCVAQYLDRCRPEEAWLELTLLGIYYNNAWINGDRINAGATLLAFFWLTGYRKIYTDIGPKGRPPRDRAWFVANSKSRAATN